MRSFIFIIGLTASITAASAAPTVQLSIAEGRVWLVARDATIAQILAEWSRVGRTTITNAEGVPSGPVTLELSGVPEQQALDVLLRQASGFVATKRADGAPIAGATQSQFDRIVIVAQSRAPIGTPTFAQPAAAPVAQATPPPFAAPQAPTFVPTATPGVQRLVGSDGRPIADDQDDDVSAANARPARGSMPPGFSAPPQVAPPVPPPAAAPTSTPQSPVGVPVPGMMTAPPQRPGAPQPATPQPAPPRRPQI